MRIKIGRFPILWAAIALLASSLVHYLDFARWPGNPDWDVHHSIFAAENFLTTGKLRSIDLYPDFDDDLAAHAEIRWMTQWPPMHSLLYAAIMMLGLSAGASTKILALLSVIVGGFGWVLLLRALGAPTSYLVAAAFAYPWLSFVARIYLDYKNDHWSCALAPWICLTIIQIPPLITRPSENIAQIIGTGFLAGIGVTLKYSMIPFVISSILYLLWLDGFNFSKTRIWRVTIFSIAILAPGIFILIVNTLLTDTPAYPLALGSGPHIPLNSYFQIVTNTFAYPVGWDLLLIQLDNLLTQYGIKIFRGTLFVATMLGLTVWIYFATQTIFSEKQVRLLAFLVITTITLWLFLLVATVNDSHGHVYLRNERAYLPVGLAWLTIWCVLLFGPQKRHAFWVAALAFILIPIIFSSVFFFLSGARREPFAAMPRSMTAWYDPEESTKPKPMGQKMENARFLADLLKHRGGAPDLVVAPSASFLSELGVPCFFTFRATNNDGHTYFSSKKLQVWAVIPRDEEEVLSAKFRNAASKETVKVPDQYPYMVHIFNYEPHH